MSKGILPRNRRKAKKPAKAGPPSVDRLYRDMVAAVRAWIRATDPHADRITINHDYGDDVWQKAAFHVYPNNEFSRGDRMAEGGQP